MNDATDAPDVTLGYVGDPARAAGFRLAGARTWAPADGDEAVAFEQARAQCGVVLLSARIASALPAAALEAACVQLLPLVLIDPEAGAGLALDPVTRVRRQLSLEGHDEP